MAERQIDPARLEGEALRRWYSRSVDDIQRERDANAAQRDLAFFDRAETESSRAVGGVPTQTARPILAEGDDELWIATGRGGFRPMHPGASDIRTALEPEGSLPYPDFIPESPAAFEDGDLQEVGNPHNPRLRREWEGAEGRPWPKTAEGRNFDVAHRKAVGDGGTNTLDNIQPMHPEEHRAQHQRNGDAARFGRRSSIARAFGGKVEPPAFSARAARLPTLRGLGILGWLPSITGVLSGRIRTDTPIHFWNDISGLPSADDPLPRDLIA